MKAIDNHRNFLFSLACAVGLLTFAGCSSTDEEPAPAPAAPVAAEPRQASPAPRELKTVVYEDHLVVVTKRHVTGTAANTEYIYQIAVEAKKPLTSVTLVETMDPTFNFNSASPSPTGMQEGRPMWRLTDFDEGDSQSIDITVMPTAVGTYQACTSVTAIPRVCLPFFVGLPNLQLAKVGPEQVEIGQDVTWELEVKNVGTVVAESVTIDDQLPEGFTAQSPLTFDIGDLQPEESRTVEVVATANEEGSFENTAIASYRGGEPVRAARPIRVVRPSITIVKDGPAESFIFVNRPYDITVTNDGTKTLEGVVLTDTLPTENWRLISAGDGEAQDADGDEVVETIEWEIGTLNPGEQRTFRTIMTSTRPQTWDNIPAEVTTADGLSASDDVVTVWKGVPGVQQYIIDSRDPILTEDETVYTAFTKNQSDSQSITITSQVVTLSEELVPVSATGGGVIDGQIVTFPQVSLSPDEEVRYEITARGVAAGNATAIMETTTNFRPQPIVSSESTVVY